MSNVDELEIKKFEALAARWWDPTSEFKPLHEINPLRMGFLTSKTTLAGKRVLDIGCGGGILAEAMARQGADVVAIDMAEASLAVARLHQLESKLDIDYRRIPAEELAQAEPEQYDIVLLPRGTHEYAKFIRPSELASWSRDAGLTLIEQRGMTYNLLSKRYSLGNDLDVNYLAYYDKPALEERGA